MPSSSWDVDQCTPCDIIAVYKGEFDDDHRHGLGIMQVGASSALYLLPCILGFVPPRLPPQLSTSSSASSALYLLACRLSSLPFACMRSWLSASSLTSSALDFLAHASFCSNDVFQLNRK